MFGKDVFNRATRANFIGRDAALVKDDFAYPDAVIAFGEL